MKRQTKLGTAIRLNLAAFAGIALPAFTGYATAQDATDQSKIVEEVPVIGSRLRSPGLESSSLLTSIDEAELDLIQEPTVEGLVRDIPGVIPGDNPAVNNGTGGAATIDLRGLGPQRNLVLINGRRLVPYNFNGIVDTNNIPSALIESIELITGGASAVFGSDAIAGAINLKLKTDFEGVELQAGHSQTGDSDGKRDFVSLTLGSNFDDNRGNAVLSFSYSDRDAVLLGQRPLGQLGINSNTGSGLDEFNAGEPPLAAQAGCGGPNVVDLSGSGSTTAIPTRFELLGTAVAGQFREDRTLGDNCSRFNFNPFNYYQTPLQRYSGTALANYEINDHVEVYGSLNYTNSTVSAQVAPSGTFGASFNLPLANPFISLQALQFILDGANGAVADGTLVDGETWNDANANGVVDAEDRVDVRLRRRTLELGPRSERFDSGNFQLAVGARGDITDSWKYDAFYSYGESNRTTVRGGYTNLTNIQNALNSTDGINCENGDPTCVPIDLFGGFGTITPEMAGYAGAIALQQQKYEQEVISLSADGSIDAVQLPTASDPLVLTVGIERRQETGLLEPDECLKLAPASCQGGAGGNLLPVEGGYTVKEYFFEAGLPIAKGLTGAESLDLKMGYRSSDYNTTGSANSWYLGANWRPVESVMFRLLQQRANRAPNVGELFSPQVTALRNATVDPCSVGNVDNIDAGLRELCIATGMTDAQVGVIPDIISGQINTIEGADLLNPPAEEQADTLTAGIVFTPDVAGLTDFMVSVDYYDIEIKDVIGLPSAQETLDSCYIAGVASECDKVNRVTGDLTGSASGIELFTTNLNYEQARGIEIAFDMGISLGDMGDLSFAANINKYLIQESQSSDITPVLECVGYYGTSCDPIADLRFVQRTTWTKDNLTVSARWRHISAIDIEPGEREGRFEQFTTIDSYSYIDLAVDYNLFENLSVTFGVDNLFDKAPPIVGNDVGDTSSNSGNTFPGNYETLGRMLKAGFTFRI